MEIWRTAGDGLENGLEMDWRVVELALFSRHHVGSAVEHAPLVAGERMDASLDGKAARHGLRLGRTPSICTPESNMRL